MYGSSSKFGLILLLILFVQSLSAAGPAKKTTKEPEKVIPLFQGIQVGVELGRPAIGLLSGEKGYSIKADVNLKNAWFPTFETGYDNFDRTAESGTRCIASGNFFKIGLNKPVSFLGDKAENLFFAGLHYGLSSFTYSLYDLNWYPNYWGDNATTFYTGQKGLVGWAEVQVGVRVQVWGPFSLGWTGQYKSTLHVSGSAVTNPAYVPGYGENLKPMAGLAFHLYYRLPL